MRSILLVKQGCERKRKISLIYLCSALLVLFAYRDNTLEKRKDFTQAHR
jgi:hypothetical protein